jgi:sortase A
MSRPIRELIALRSPLLLGVSLVVPALAFSLIICLEQGSIPEIEVEGRYEFCSCVSLMARSTITKTFSGFERLLVFSGLLLISAYLAVSIYSAVYSRATIRAFWRNQAVTSSRPGNSFRRNAEIPDFRLWSPQRVKAYQASLAANIPSPLGDLEIPSLKIEVPVLDGTDELTLNRGVGHIDGTPLPGEAGNIGVAGHRDGFFRGLKDLRVGDSVDLYSQNGNTRYVVDEIRIVPPEDVSVLGPRSRPSITLVTCYPFYFVGSAPLRYIVHASTEYPINLNASGQQSLWNRKQGPEN